MSLKRVPGWIRRETSRFFRPFLNSTSSSAGGRNIILMNLDTMRKTIFLFTFLFACATCGYAVTGKQQAQQNPTLTASDELATKSWTGDLDGMQKRRRIRVLTVFSKTFYFVDKGTPRGLVYDAMKQFEDVLNKKLKTGHLKIHVVFIPVARDELLPGLLQGRGDIAAANLTITPERLKTVDFTDPVYKNVSEIILTGPASPAIASIDDLSGKEVYVRKSSSYYESLTELNEQFKKQNKSPVKLKLAPENLENEDLIEMLNAGLVKFIVVDQHIATFWKQIFPKVTLRSDITLRQEGNIGWAIRQNSPLLKQELNGRIAAFGKGNLFGNMLLQKYLKNIKYVKNAATDAEFKKFEQTIEFFKKYSDKYSVDYLL